MIVVDALRQWTHGLGPRMGPSCHMCSTLSGAEGTAELIAFAARIGMRPGWIQRKGTPHEHFDLFGRRRERAVQAGATELDRHAMATVWREKRAKGNGTP